MAAKRLDESFAISKLMFDAEASCNWPSLFTDAVISPAKAVLMLATISSSESVAGSTERTAEVDTVSSAL